LASSMRVIWTIGHSNRSKETFLELLKEHGIEIRARIDVRSFPTSKIEYFKREDVVRWLPEARDRICLAGQGVGRILSRRLQGAYEDQTIHGWN
jgi:uncharacterized protein (DUF488 family)